ncbi:CvpA family protein [candidate division KSB1 bacterium]|nr:CvpA family protein [candidate division KSB1 bacterium]
MSFSFWDVAIVIAIGYFTWKGYKNGCIDNLIGFFGFMIVMFFAVNHMGRLADYLSSSFQADRILLTIIAFAIILSAGWFFMRLIVQKLQFEINPSEKAKRADHVAGGILGLIQGCIVVSLVAMLIRLTPFSGPLDAQRERSVFLKPAMRMAPLIYQGFSVIFPGAKNFEAEIVRSLSKDPNNPRAQQFLQELRDSGSSGFFRNNRSGFNPSGRKNRRR